MIQPTSSQTTALDQGGSGPNCLSAFQCRTFWITWLWIFLPPILIASFYEKSYLRLSLPRDLQVLVTMTFGLASSVAAFLLMRIAAQNAMGRLISKLSIAVIIFHHTSALAYFFSAHRRLSVSEVAFLKREMVFLLWYFFQSEPWVIIGILMLGLLAWTLAHVTVQAAATKAGYPGGSTGLFVSLWALGISLLAYGLVCWKAPSLWAPSQFHRADSYAGWSWKAAKSLVPLFEWTEYLLPERMSTQNVPGYIGQPRITPEVYYRANQNNLRKNALRSLIVVQLESVRFDVINQSVNGRAVTPFLNSLAREGLFFRKAYANSAQTNYAALCAPLGVYPLRSRFPYLYRKEDTSPHYMLHDLLKPFGYRTLFFSSQYEGWAGMDTYWRTSSLDWYLDSTGYGISSEGGVLNYLRNRKRFAGNTDDSVTVGKFLQFLKSESSEDRPFLAFLSLENGHFPYPLPDSYQRPFEPGRINFPASYLNFPRERIGVLKNAYWNVVSYMDNQLQRLYDGMVAQGMAKNTILVILADHGEELFDTGFPTHGTKLCDPVLHIPLIIHDKRQAARIVDSPVSQADIAPTILGMLGLDPFPGHQGIDVLNHPRESLSRRPIFFHTNGLGQQDGVLVWPWKLIIDIESGEGNLYNLEWGEVTSGEQRHHHPFQFETLKHCLRDFSEGQLAYYTHEDLHGKFFPPCPRCADNPGPD